MTQFPDLFAALNAPFDDREVRVRTQAGRQLSYITARTAMNRLDAVLGPESWWDEYLPGEHSVICKLTVRLPDGSTLTKSDAGGYAGMADQGDDDKSGFSDAFKRAAVKFGVGRYLYRDGVPTFAQEQEPAVEPTPPAPTLEAPAPPAALPAPGIGTPAAGRSRREEWRPADGRELLDWIRDQEVAFGVPLLDPVKKWGVGKGYPAMLKHWNAEQSLKGMRAGERYVRRKLDAVEYSQEVQEVGS